MEKFSIKCDNCGTLLEASEEYLDCKVSCYSCDYHFVLQKTKPIVLYKASNEYPDMFENIKIGKLALCGFQILFNKEKFDDSLLERLQNIEESKKLFGFGFPLLVKKTNSLQKKPLINGYYRHWQNPIVIKSREYFLCSQWFEYHRDRLIEFFQQYDITYDELLSAFFVESKNNSSKEVIYKTDNDSSINHDILQGNNIFSFDKPPKNVTFTKPLMLCMEAQTIAVKSWSDILFEVCSYVIKKQRHAVNLLIDKTTPFKNCIIFASNSTDLLKFKSIVENVYIETNFSAKDIVYIVCSLVRFCQMPLERFTITYSNSNKNNKVNEDAEAKIMNNKNNFELNPEIKGNVLKVLEKHFTNGFRFNSPIELMRFRSFYKDIFENELDIDDDILKEYIVNCGTIFEEKIYTVKQDTKDKIIDIANEYFDSGASVIFFDEFYGKNVDWLFAESVVSETMLVEILRKNFFAKQFTSKYFGNANDNILNIISDEIFRIWRNDILLNYEQISERLTYIPLDRIKYSLGQNSDFIRNSKGTFTHIEKVEICQEDKNAISFEAQDKCNKNGYVSFRELPLENIMEQNYIISKVAIYESVYRICLSEKFDKKGKIIVRKGDSINVESIIEDYCKTKEHCTLQELEEFEKELTGENDNNKINFLSAAYATMIRIDKDNFISDKLVDFNILAIDKVLDDIVSGLYFPLKEFTTFSAFPYCGQTWTLFLLESYCRRFSLNYRFDVPSVNSKNAGAIINKKCILDYIDIMADSVAMSNIDLEENIVIDFLYKKGYIGRRSTSFSVKIIEKAKNIRDKGNLI